MMDAAARIVSERDDGERVSARELAKRCLGVIGKDIGAGSIDQARPNNNNNNKEETAS